MRRGLSLWVLAIVPLLFSASCSLPKPYVGRQVNTNAPMWCRVNRYAPDCKVQQGAFLITIKIKETDEENVYIASGTVDATKGELKSWSSIAKASFVLILAKDNVVTDYIPVSLLGTDMGKPIPYRRKFTSEAFDSVTMIWEITARG